MRITTNMILRNYGNGLSKASNSLNDARNTVLTQRKFNRMSEDPSAAVKSFRLRRAYARNDDHMNTLAEVQSQTDSIYESEMQIKKMLDESYQNVLTAHNDTASIDERKIIARNLRETAQSMVLSANVKFGDQYLFNGAKTDEPPFNFDQATGILEYRGLDVSDPANQAALEALTKEHFYRDIGFGMTTQGPSGTGNIDGSTVFDSATSGLNLLGYGLDADGDPENIVNLLCKVADEMEKEPYERATMDKMLDKVKGSLDHVLDSMTQLSTKSEFLENTKERLKTQGDNINEQIVNLEDADMAESITAYMWAQYAYNSALKVGNSVLSSSFIDFMN